MPDKKPYLIRGIQQLGVGVENAQESWEWYKKHLGADIKVFDNTSTNQLKSKHTDNQKWKRRVIMAINLQGGGGLELWQHLERKPHSPQNEIQLGDLGINFAKIKCPDVQKARYYLRAKEVRVSEVFRDPAGKEFFYMEDSFGNLFQLIQSNDFFKEENKATGLVYGATIGITNVKRAFELYSNVLGYNEVIYDAEGKFSDLEYLPGGDKTFRRILLAHTDDREGGFGRLLGPSQIELIQVQNREPNKISENRIIGDLGYFHLCFDVSGLQQLREELEKNGFEYFPAGDENGNVPHAVELGDASSVFAYTEDFDGTLIEFSEAHRIPIVKSLGVKLNLKKRDPLKPIPNWLLRALKFNK